MLATALPRIDWSRFRLSRSECWRALAAGSVWAVCFTAGLTALTSWQCGGICLPEVADNAVLALLGGILGVGAVAAYGRR
jgi:hypothetical protein